MLLKSLYLKNFRTYKGPEEINFANGDKNITIIQGDNEVGKTTIMNAITWCIYGAEYYKKPGNEPIWSKSTSYDMENGEEDFVEVRLIMEDAKGKEVKFVHKLEFYKNDNGDCVKGSSNQNIYIDEVPVSFKDTYISKHMPKNIRKYYLFDGEQLENYFDEDNDIIKKSVYQLSQLNLLKKTKTHLDTRKKEFANKLDKLNPKLSYYMQKKIDKEEKLEKKEETLSETNTNIKNWESKKAAAEEKIRLFGDNPEKLINQKRDLENKLKKLDYDIANDTEDLNKFLFTNFPKVMSINSLLDVKEICHDLEEKGFIPARYKKEFLEYLLEQHECICGADLSEGSEAYNKMKQLCDETDEATNIADTVNILLGSINTIIDNFPRTFKEDLKQKRSDISDLNEERKQVSKQITNINNLLSEDDEEEITKLQGNIQTYENLIKTNSEKIGTYKEQIKNLKEEIKDLEEKIAEEEGKATQKTDIERSIDFCQTASDEIYRIYKELEEDIHSKLQELTSEEFTKIHWKKEFYKGVTIDEDFNVVIHKETGDIVPNDLSKGGQLVLALSFMTALNSLSGFELPIIIDTPLSRLDEPIKANIGKYLHDYTKTKQVTLLVTGSEYSDGFRKEIRDYVGKKYTLNYNKIKDGITTIDEN